LRIAGFFLAMAIVNRWCDSKHYSLDLAGAMPGTDYVYSGGRVGGKKLCAFPHHGKRNQQFKFERVSGDLYLLKNMDNYMYLTESDTKFKHGYKCLLARRAKGDNADYQVWQKKEVGNSFILKCKAGGRVVEFASADSSSSNALVVTGPETGANTQKWWHAKKINDVGWNLLAVGSAGEGLCGQAKAETKAASGWLSTDKDVEDCKTWFLSKFRSGSKVFSDFNLGTNAAKKDFVKQQIKELFEDCAANDLAPLIYYTGHGYQGSGNWVFKDGGISLDEIQSIWNSTRPGWEVVIYSDCCHSGHWTAKAGSVSMKPTILSAADTGDHGTATDRTFANAIFNNNAGKDDAKKKLSSNWARANTEDKSQMFFKGDFHSLPNKPMKE